MKITGSPSFKGFIWLIVPAVILLFCVLFIRTEEGIGRRIVRFSMYKYEAYDKFRRAAGKDFEKAWNQAHPEDPIEVRYEPIGGNYVQKINAEVVADTLQDLFFVPPSAYQEFAEKGILMALDGQIEANGDWGEIREIHPSLLDDNRYNGTLYALPNNCNVDVLYYNKTLFDRAGIAHPQPDWTWEKVRQVARKLTIRDSDGRTLQYGLIVPKYLPFILRWFGGQITQNGPDGNQKPALTSEATVKAVRFFQDLVYKDRVTPTPAEEQGEQGLEAFKNGRAAMIPGMRWYSALFMDLTDLDWAVAPLPLNDQGERASIMVGNHLAISARTRHPDVAYHLLLHLTSPEQIGKLVDLGDSIPIRRSSFPEFQKRSPRPLEEIEAYNMSLETPKGARFEKIEGISGSFVYKEVNRVSDRVLLSGNTDVREVLQRAQNVLEQEQTRAASPKPRPQVPFFVAVLSVILGVPLLFGIYMLTKKRNTRAVVVGSSLRRSNWGYLFILPNAVGFLAFTLLPVVFSMVIAFTNWDLLSNWEFAGFRNFQEMVKTPEFWKYFWNTLFLMAGIPIGMAGSLFLAVILNQKLRGRMFFRSVFFLPSFTAGVAIYMLWRWIYNPEFGLLNRILAPVLLSLERLVLRTPEMLWTLLGALLWLMAVVYLLLYIRHWIATREPDGDAIARGAMLLARFLLALVAYFAGWSLMNLPEAAATGLEAPRWLSAIHNISLGPLFGNLPYRFDWAKPAFMIVGIWAGVGGFNMILYLAGLQGISPELYEAAGIDGANRWQKFLHVTWPLLSPTTFFIFIMSVIGGFQGGFEAAYVMTQGGPDGATTTLSYHIYEHAFELYRMGYAAALSWFLFLVVLAVTLVNWRYGGRRVHY